MKSRFRIIQHGLNGSVSGLTSTFRVLDYCLPGYKKKFTLLVCMSAMCGIVDILTLSLFSILISIYTSEGASSTSPYLPEGLLAFSVPLQVWTAALIAVSLFGALFKVSTQKKQIKLTAKITSGIGSSVFNSVSQMPYQWHLTVSKAHLVSNLTNDLDKVALAMQSITTLGTSVGIVIVIIPFLLVVDHTLVLVLSAALAFVYIIISVQMKSALAKNGNLISTEYQLSLKTMQDALVMIKNILIESSHQTWRAQYERHYSRFRYASSDIMINSQIPKIYIESSILAVAAIILLVLSSGSDTSHITKLSVLSLGLYKVLQPFQNIFHAWSHLEAHKISCKRLLAQLKRASPTDPELVLTTRNTQHKDQKLGFKYVHLKDVSYSYPGSTSASITEINLSIKKGENLGLVGRSGSGKSTFIDILTGLLKPTDGDILIGDKSLIANNRLTREWQGLIALTTQKAELLDSNVYFNIANSTECNKDTVNKLLSDLSFFDQKPISSHENQEKLKSGINLSGGEKQKVSIARAIYSNKPIIILDEPNSALDQKSDSVVMNKVYSLTKEKTLIIISHRIESLFGCDRIAVFEKGRIVDVGTFDELNSRCALFQDLIVKRPSQTM